MKTSHSLPFAGAALAVALLGIAPLGVASAQEATAGGNTDASFQSLDKNHDGQLARSEIPSNMALLRTRLSTYDDNHDGMLNAQEFAAAESALNGNGHPGGSDSSSSPKSPPPGGG